MVQHALDHFISNAYLAKTGSERASQVMSVDIENPIVAGHPGYSPRCRASSDCALVCCAQQLEREIRQRQPVFAVFLSAMCRDHPNTLIEVDLRPQSAECFTNPDTQQQFEF
jgi:hypothetical protein